MSDSFTLRNEQLPAIPDDPKPPAPLSAWKHYYILRALEERLHAHLKEMNYSGRAVGLEIKYTVGDDGYTMGYGYSFTEAGELPEEMDPLTDEFVSEAYVFVHDLIAKHIDPSVLSFQLEISASINPVGITVQRTCQIANAGNCNNPACHGNCRWFKNVNNTGWKCTHQACQC